MTSMPASRRARAITLAPRSWPSRPGFATRTRIFASSATRSFNHRYRDCKKLRRLYVEASPQVPASHTAMGLPRPGDLFHLLWVGHLAFLVELHHGHSHAEI